MTTALADIRRSLDRSFDTRRLFSRTADII